MIDRYHNALCGVCRRLATGLAIMPRPRDRPMWICDDPACIQTARNTYNMKQERFERLESLAAQRGGIAGGHYLDQIGKSDLRTLTAEEFAEFNRRVVGGYRKALAEELAAEAPF